MRQMIVNRKLISVLVLAVAVLAADIAYAEPANGSHWYVGGGVGVSNVKKLCVAGTSSLDCDDEGSAVRVFGGLQLNPYFAIEATMDMGGNWRSPGARSQGYDGKTGALMLGVNAIGTIPVGSRFSLLAGVTGAFTYVSTDIGYGQSGSYTTCYSDSSYSDWYDYCYDHRYEHHDYVSNSSVSGGGLVGFDVEVARSVHVRAQAQRFANVKADLAFDGHRDIDFFTINALYKFR